MKIKKEAKYGVEPEGGAERDLKDAADKTKAGAKTAANKISNATEDTKDEIKNATNEIEFEYKKERAKPKLDI
ncbi:MAG TPA: hypothetical protein VF016_09440 [Nitrososphaera sp.]|jgi:hypothetical protein|nr:hypothetical protein [uncultured Nitrososphaera sp.]